MNNLRQSNLKHLLSDCEYRYGLSLKHDIEQTDAMREGIIFESLVLGKKSDEIFNDAVGRKKKETIEFIEVQAKHVKEQFRNVTPFVKVHHEHRGELVTGEIDAVGDVWVKDGFIRAIIDLKYTGSIMNNWEELSREQHLQSVQYPYLWFHEHGELLPFVYKIVDNKYKFPIVKTRMVTTTMQDFEWLESLWNRAIDTRVLMPNDGYATCTNRFSPCRYMEHCEFGRKFLGSTDILNFGEMA